MTNTSQPGQQPPTPFRILQHRVAEAHWRWKVWKQLYMGKHADDAEALERVRLMNSWAPAFFTMLKSLLIEDVVLRVCKLADAPKGGPAKAKRRNLSLSAALVDAQSRLTLSEADRASSLIQAFRIAVEPMIKLRNWRIAHEDYDVATGVEDAPAFTDKDVETAMASAVGIMELLDPEFGIAEFGYKSMLANDDGDSLVYALRCADVYHKDRMAKQLGPLR